MMIFIGVVILMMIGFYVKPMVKVWDEEYDEWRRNERID